MLASVWYWPWTACFEGFWFNEHLASRTGAVPVAVSLLRG